jgi:hypothetical protein
MSFYLYCTIFYFYFFNTLANNSKNGMTYVVHSALCPTVEQAVSGESYPPGTHAASRVCFSFLEVKITAEAAHENAQRH